MSALRRRPHISMQHTDIMAADAEITEDTTWYDHQILHIAGEEESSNNMWIGDMITMLIGRVKDHPDRWWRILYYEEVSISTGEGQTVMNARSNKRLATDLNRHEVHQEEFRDRNADTYYEFNRGLPRFEEYPRFYTEHDSAEATMTAVAKEAEAGAKGDPEAKPGEEVVGEDQADETLHVSDGDIIEVYDEMGHKTTVQISVV